MIEAFDYSVLDDEHDSGIDLDDGVSPLEAWADMKQQAIVARRQRCKNWASWCARAAGRYWLLWLKDNPEQRKAWEAWK